MSGEPEGITIAVDPKTGGIGNTSVPKTATDLAIEKLTAELEEMKKAHAEQVRQLEEANKGLWAAAHPAPAQITDTDPAPTPGFDTEKATDAFYKALGRRE